LQSTTVGAQTLFRASLAVSVSACSGYALRTLADCYDAADGDRSTTQPCLAGLSSRRV
jgi:hypothetical protein